MCSSGAWPDSGDRYVDVATTSQVRLGKGSYINRGKDIKHFVVLSESNFTHLVFTLKSDSKITSQNAKTSE